MTEEEGAQEIDTLLNELHNTNNELKKSTNTFTLSSTDLKQFLLDQAGQLIKGSVDCVNNYKELLGGNPDFKEAGALAELIKAASATIESLNKVYIQDERSKAAVQVETIRADVKREISHNTNTTNSVTIKMTRKQLMDTIFKSAQTVKEPIKDNNMVDI